MLTCCVWMCLSATPAALSASIRRRIARALSALASRAVAARDSTPNENPARSGLAFTAPSPVTVIVRAIPASPWACSGNPTPASAANASAPAARPATASDLLHWFLRLSMAEKYAAARPFVTGSRFSLVRYRFVDCRWALGDPEPGGGLYLEGHIPGASFLDVDADLVGSARRRAGGIRCPRAERLRRRSRPRRDRRRRLRRRLRQHGRRRAALVAAAPLRPRRLRGARRSTAGAARWRAARRPSSRRRSSRGADGRHDRARTSSPRGSTTGSSSSTRGCPTLARRAEPGRPRPGPHPGRA